jgi:hypothetical protein
MEIPHGLRLVNRIIEDKGERIEQDFGVWRTKYSAKRVAMAPWVSPRATATSRAKHTIWPGRVFQCQDHMVQGRKRAAMGSERQLFNC